MLHFFLCQLLRKKVAVILFRCNPLATTTLLGPFSFAFPVSFPLPLFRSGLTLFWNVNLKLLLENKDFKQLPNIFGGEGVEKKFLIFFNKLKNESFPIILNKIKKVDAEELADAENELKEFLDYWLERANTEELKYFWNHKKINQQRKQYY